MNKVNEFIKNIEEKERKNKEEQEKKKFAYINKQSKIDSNKKNVNEDSQKKISEEPNKEKNIENQPKIVKEKINEKILKYLNTKKEESQTQEQNELKKLFEKRRKEGSKCLEILKQKEDAKKAKIEALKQKSKEEEENNRKNQSLKRIEFIVKQEEVKIIKKEEDKKKLIEEDKKNEELHWIRFQKNKKREDEEEEAKRKKEEEKTRKIDEEIQKINEQEKKRKEEEEKIRKEEEEKRRKEEEERRKEEEERRKEEEKRRKEEEKRREEERERLWKIKQERLQREREEEEKRRKEEEELRKKEEEERKKIEEEIRKKEEEERKKREEEKKKKEEEERKKNELFIKNKKKGYENLKNIPQLYKLYEQNLQKMIGEDNIKALSEEEKFNIFDRKINNIELEENLHFDFSLKNAEKDKKYDVEIYDDENKLLGKINNNEKNNENKELTFKNLSMNFNFAKVQSVCLKLKKNVNDNDTIIKTKIIPLKALFGEITGKYEEKIIDFLGDESFSINLIKSYENDDNQEKENSNNSNKINDKLIRLKFKSLISFSLYSSKSIVSYTIEKNQNILFKSPFCSDSNIQNSDKIPIELLKPTFDICFYNVCYEEKRYTIKYDELFKGVEKDVNFTDTNFNININSEEVKPNKLLKLLEKGLNIELIIAIDFTESNGDKDNPSSLHYIKDNFVNNYEKAIREIYEIFSTYNKSNQCDLFGFGGSNFYFKNPKYCFDIDDIKDDNIDDVKNNEQNIEKIISLYKKAVNTTIFGTGTFFSSVIVKTYNIIRNKMIKNKGTNSLNYNVLLIISDGKIHDIDWTIAWLKYCSNLPFSVVVIGVGEHATKDMKILNGEISFEGKIIENNNVHYVHFKDFNGNIKKLRENALRYIPENISEYFEKIKSTGEKIPDELVFHNYSYRHVEQD